MNQVRPGQMAGLFGSALLLVSCFVDWVGRGSFGLGVLDDNFGFTGVFVVLIALALTAVAVIRAFAPQVTLPAQLLGFSLDQLVISLAFAMVVYGLSITFLSVAGSNAAKIGAFLAWIGGAAVIAGLIIDQRTPAAPADPTPPADPPPPTDS
ncbi:MAG: hypothetical protein GY929_06400 [Actinomycetia bacterium]|nr:hypothetical protein [Actinomycetes bacterium]